jgi:hypothetical protein
LNCPLCKIELKVIRGSQLNPNDGYTAYCPSRDCPAQEVAGHGNSVEKAFQVITDKFPINENAI